MRTHGWGGQVPDTDEEAQRRILAATRQCIDEKGAATGIADVARVLGVTRQTVYRYFPGTEALLAATSRDAADDFLDRVEARLAGDAEPDQAVVDGICVVLDELSRDRYIGLMLGSAHLSVPVIGDITSGLARTLARATVERLGVDWAAKGFAPDDLDIIVDLVLRTIQSVILDPGTPPRSGAELRDFLDLWVGAAVRGLPGRSASD